jgi:hypothetical protein
VTLTLTSVDERIGLENWNLEFRSSERIVEEEIKASLRRHKV